MESQILDLVAGVNPVPNESVLLTDDLDAVRRLVKEKSIMTNPAIETTETEPRPNADGSVDELGIHRIDRKRRLWLGTVIAGAAAVVLVIASLALFDGAEESSPMDIVDTPDVVVDAPEPVDLSALELGNGFGSYDVGVATVTVVDASGGDRDLTVEVWFPLDDSAGLTAKEWPFPGDLVFESTQSFVASSDDISADGPFPLVVYSHGPVATRTSASKFAEAIASHGYVVAAPDHRGDTAPGYGDPADDAPTIAFNRPHDVSAVIDAMTDVDSTETVGFAGDINAGQIAVAGQSVSTVYAVAAGYDNLVGEYEADERVVAIVALASNAALLLDDKLATIEIPALMISGTENRKGSRAWENTNSSPSYRLELVGGGDLSFTDVCGWRSMLDAAPDADAGAFRDLIFSYNHYGCWPDDIPYERALAVTSTFASTFLDSVFRGTDPIHPDQVEGLEDLMYQVK